MVGLGADELSAVAEALASIGLVERRGVAETKKKRVLLRDAINSDCFNKIRKCSGRKSNLLTSF